MWHYFVFKQWKHSHAFPINKSAGVRIFLDTQVKYFWFNTWKQKQFNEYQNNELHFSPKTIEHKRPRHLALEIQVFPWNRHTNVVVNRPSNNRTHKRPRHMALEIQVFPWNRHTNVVGLNWLILPQHSLSDKHIIGIFNDNRRHTITQMNNNINIWTAQYQCQWILVVIYITDYYLNGRLLVKDHYS